LAIFRPSKSVSHTLASEGEDCLLEIPAGEKVTDGMFHSIQLSRGMNPFSSLSTSTAATDRPQRWLTPDPLAKTFGFQSTNRRR
jgi:hypothetical protein